MGVQPLSPAGRTSQPAPRENSVCDAARAPVSGAFARLPESWYALAMGQLFGCCGSLVWLVAAISGGAARADAVPPPPTECPPGAIGVTGHNGPYCTPMGCSNDAECGDRMGYDKRARTCADVGVCVEERHESSASGWSHGAPITLRVAHAACADDGRCQVGTCERGKHCLLAEEPTPPSPAPQSPAPPTTGSKACGGCDAGASDAAAWLLFAPACLILRRRSR